MCGEVKINVGIMFPYIILTIYYMSLQIVRLFERLFRHCKYHKINVCMTLKSLQEVISPGNYH